MGSKILERKGSIKIEGGVVGPAFIETMPAHESLRIRTPPPDSQDEEQEVEQIRVFADRKARNIPAIMMGVVMMNTLTYIYTNSEVNLYAAIATGLIWCGLLLCAIYDRTSKHKIYYTSPVLSNAV